jgi:hypothetical protein
LLANLPFELQGTEPGVEYLVDDDGIGPVHLPGQDVIGEVLELLF